MLHRAASNACSWWWASHVRTKQSKWLDNNLQEMDEKVKYMLKLISEDGDSFAKRAESYYRKRPELINFVEEFSRAYKALAERYDHISGELQNANHTIATVFPEQVQYAMDEEFDAGSPTARPPKPAKIPKGLPEAPKAHIPTFVRNLKKLKKDKDKEREKQRASLSRAPSKKVQPKKPPTTNADGSEMSKDEAVTEIDKLQKGILSLQTEKEFVKSSYESRLSKYWEIEKTITDMQEKVCGLQDEFSVSTAIEDNEARTLMASTALKSCQDTLDQLQEKQEKSNKQAKLEYERVKEATQKLQALKGELYNNRIDQNPSKTEFTSEGPTSKMLLEQEASDLKQEIHDAESICAKIREHFEMNSGISLSVPELAEKIDELVTKVISLETAVSTQTALINRLRSETNNLHGNLRTLEEDKATLLQDSDKLNKKVRELEGELQSVQNLNRNVENQNNNLQTHFTEAHCNLDHLSEKLKCVKPMEEEYEMTNSSQIGPEMTGPPKADVEVLLNVEPRIDSAKKKATGAEEVRNTSLWGSDQGDGPSAPNSSSDPEDVSKQSQQPKQLNDIGKHDSTQPEDGPLISEAKQLNSVAKQLSIQLNDVDKQVTSELEDGFLECEPQEQFTDQDDEPNWQKLFLNALDDRERILLTEYTSILRKYKETRKQLSELQMKKNDGQFEAMVQLRELKSTVAIKDEEIQSLRQKLKIMQESDNSLGGLSSQSCSQPITSFEHQQIADLLEDRNVEVTASSDASTSQRATENFPTQAEKEDRVKSEPADDDRVVSSMEEKFRRDIDELLEENLEFWLRFSGLFHQIQKFQTSIEDLQGEYVKIKEKSQEDSGSSKHSHSLKSEARPIYKHLREIQTELTVWVEQNMLLKDEVKYRLSSLSNIQDELTRVSKTSTETDVDFTSYQAAKFQGEVLNMQQENNKVANELQAGLEHVKGLQTEVEKSVHQMEDELKLSHSKHHPNPVIHSMSRTRVPLRSFLFGAKAKKQKPSFFACINPALHKQSSDMQGFRV